ncbi:MAG: pilus assembly PilX N-terminal domain-containing protein [Candidatus Krumholzibacteriota bacterium]|nr:pilus assembly PilX N-terminal domain-containing protein [Candidatus Krumholzibacteriota bacterium]
MNNNKTVLPLGEKGNILVITLIILFAVSVIGGTLAMVSSMNLKIAGNERTTAQSLFVAEAGINEAIHRLSISDPTIVTVDGWTGNAAIGDSKPYDPNWQARIYLTSPGTAPASAGSVYSTGTLQSSSSPYLRYSNPSGTDDLLTIEHKWIDRNGDSVRDANEIVLYDPMMIPPENFTSGFPIEIISVTGSSAGGRRVLEAEVVKRMLICRTLGALYVDKAVKLTGQSHFCGFNHDINIPPGTVPNACFAHHLPTGNLPGVTATGDVVNAMGSVNIEGDPVPIDNSATNPFYTLAEALGISDLELNGILANADNTSIVDPLDGITYIDGDANIASSALTGTGLLYITGDLKAAGSFQFKGLVYVEGDVMFTGMPWILGSMIVRGTSDFNFSSGNAAILYSQEAISQALSSAMPVMMLSWKER